MRLIRADEIYVGTETEFNNTPALPEGAVFYITDLQVFKQAVKGVWRDLGSGGGSGEDNTASNLGAGDGLFAQKVGVDLQFKSLIEGDNVVLTPDANTVTIAVPSVASNVPTVLFSQVEEITVANTTDTEYLTGAGRGTRIIPANTLEQGTALRLTFRGYFSATGTPTLAFESFLGGISVGSTPAVAVNAVTDGFWSLSILLTCLEFGATGKVVASGEYHFDDGSAGTFIKKTQTTIDTTGELPVEIEVTWGTADPLNVLVCQHGMIEIMNMTGTEIVGPGGLTATVV